MIDKIIELEELCKRMVKDFVCVTTMITDLTTDITVVKKKGYHVLYIDTKTKLKSNIFTSSMPKDLELAIMELIS